MSKIVFHELETERLQFKALSLEDYEAIHEYASNEEVSRFIGWPLTRSLTETKDFFGEMIKKVDEGTHIYANVVEKTSKKIIGTVTLFNFDKVASKAEIGYVFHQESWGKGYASEVVKAVCNYGFEVLELHKIYAQVAHVNIGSIRVLEHNLFSKEGLLKDHYYIEDTYYDCVLFGRVEE